MASIQDFTPYVEIINKFMKMSSSGADMSKKDKKDSLTELEKIIEDFFSGKLNDTKERSKKQSVRTAKSVILETNNCVYFPSVSVLDIPRSDTLTLF